MDSDEVCFISFVWLNEPLQVVRNIFDKIVTLQLAQWSDSTMGLPDVCTS